MPGSRAPLARILDRRCFALLLALLALLVGVPIFGDSRHGRTLIGLLDILILGAAVAAVARSRLSLAIAGVLGLPVLIFQVLALQSDLPGPLALSWGFAAGFYVFALVQLLQYVLRPDAITADKLYGAVAVYLMLGITWAFGYGVLQYFHPGAFTLGGTVQALEFPELIYFSFVVLTSTGFGDILPAVTQARFLVILEVMTGVMYVAILIARLTGVYPGAGKER
jgi:hypothetical protein